MATFGKTTNGGSTSNSSANRVWVSKHSPGTSGVIQTGHARCFLSAAGSTNLKACVYADSSGEPGALLAESDVLVLTSTTEAERVFTFSGENIIEVVGGTDYWIGYGWNDPGSPSVSVSRDGTASLRREQTATSGPTFPDPYGTPLASNTGPIDFYITYDDTVVLDPPGSVYDLTNWKITLPTDGPDGGTNADEITQSALDTYADINFFLNGSNEMEMRAPVQGATTSGSGATRCELREMEDDGTVEAAWDPHTEPFRQLTVSGYFDPTPSTDRKEMIIGQVHGASGTPPLYLACEHHVSPTRIRIYKDGPGLSNPVTTITPSTLITYRMRAESGTISLWCVAGTVSDLASATPTVWDAGDFTDDVDWYFKAGAYNKSEVVDSGTGTPRSRIVFLELLQSQPAASSELFFLGVV